MSRSSRCRGLGLARLLIAALLAVAALPSAAFAWTPPANLSLPGVDGSQPATGLAGDGTAIFAWVRDDGLSQRAQFRTRAADGALGPVRNASAGGSTLDSLALDTNEAGQTAMVWRRFDGSNWRAQLAIRQADGTIVGPVDLSAAGADAGGLDVGIDDAGDVVAVWERDQLIQMRTRIGGVLGPVSDLTTNATPRVDPVVDVAASGEAAAVWRRLGAVARVEAARISPAGTAGGPRLLSTASADANSPDVGVADDGSAVAVWDRSTVVQMRPIAIDGTPGATRRISQPPAREPVVSVNGPGDAIAAFVATWDGFDRVQVVSRPAGGPVAARRSLSVRGENGSLPQIELADDRRAIATWHRPEGIGGRVQSRAIDSDGTSGVVKSLSPFGQVHGRSAPAINQNGGSVASWARFDGAVNRIQASAAAPIVRMQDGPQTFTEGDPSPGLTLDSAMRVRDYDGATLESATIKLIGAQPGDSLGSFPFGAVTPSWNPVTDELTLSTAGGPAPIGDFVGVLSTVFFTNSSEDPSTTSRSVEVTVSDGSFTSRPAETQTIDVAAVNDPPVNTPAGALTDEDTDVLIALTATDPDSGAVTFVKDSGPANGTLTIAADGTGTYTPDADFNGTDSFQYTSSDGEGGTDTDTYNIDVAAVDDAPTVDLDATGPLTYTENAGFVNLFGANATVEDADGGTMDSLVVDVTAGFDSAFDALQVNAAGFDVASSNGGATITITRTGGGGTPADFTTALRNTQFRNVDDDPDDRNDGTANPAVLARTVEVVADDGALTSSPQQRQVDISAVDDAPTDGDESQDATGNTRLEVELTSGQTGNPRRTSSTGNVLDNATDPDDLESALVVSPEDTTDPAGGSVALNSDGSHVYTPDPGFTGSDSFQYRVEGAGGAESALSTVSVTVSDRVWYVRADAPAGGDGRSETPFNSLAAADEALGNAAGDTFYVFRRSGDAGTASDTQLDLLPNQRLIGSEVDLTIGGQTLYSGAVALRPTLLNTSVRLDDGNTVRGLAIQGTATDEAIQAGSNDQSGTLDKLLITGSAGGIEIAGGAAGTWDLSDIAVNTSGGDAISAVGAGTVNFVAASGIGLTAAGGRGLNVTGTTTSGTVDSTTVTSSPTQGINLDDNLGSLTLNDINLATSGVGLKIDSSDGVTVSGGDADIASAGGAVALTTETSDPADMPDVTLDVVSSSGGAFGIEIDGIGDGTFSATGGAISGATDAAVRVDEGGGDVTYPGAINNGEGQTARISQRTGGRVTLSGPISEAGDADGVVENGGISLSANSGGFTDVTHASTKDLSTGEDHAVVMSTSDGHTLSFTNGNLDIDTTSGNGLDATTSGTLLVSGGGNTIDATALAVGNRAFNMVDTDFAAADVTFERISASGGINAIRLQNTGTAGNLSITGNGADHSGGTMQNQSSNAVSLSSTDNFFADEVNIQNPARDGFSGTNVTHFAVHDSTVNNAGQSDVDITDSAFAFNTTSNANENNIDGTVEILRNTITNPYGGGVDIFNHSGTISDLNVSSNTLTSGTLVGAVPGGGDNDSVEDAIQVVTFGGTGFAASLTKGAVSNNNITGFPDGTGIEFLGGSQGTTQGFMGTRGNSTNKVVISGNLIRGHSSAIPMGQNGIVADVEGRGGGHFEITNNGSAGTPIANVLGSAILAGNAGDADAEFEITGNRADLDTSIAGSSGIGIGTDKDTIADNSVLADPDIDVNVANNVVTDSAGSAIRVLHRDSNGTINLKMQNNEARSRANNGTPGISINNGSSGDNAFDPTMCAVISGNTAEGAVDGFGDKRPGLELFKRIGVTDNDGSYTFGIQGLAPSPATGTQAEDYVSLQNPASIIGNSSDGSGFFNKKAKVRSGNHFESCTVPAF